MNKKVRMAGFKLGIVGRLFIAMAIGVATGFFAPEWVVRLLNSFSGLFGQFIGFTP